MALDIDEPEGDSFRTQVLGMRGFNDMLQMNGFGAHDDANGDLRLWVTNSKPSVDAETGEFLDNCRVGANTTVELFRLPAGTTDEVEHVRTYYHPLISTPNRVTPVIKEDKNDFWVTNDHGQEKIGLVRIYLYFIPTPHPYYLLLLCSCGVTRQKGGTEPLTAPTHLRNTSSASSSPRET